jgi:hypothetical protein
VDATVCTKKQSRTSAYASSVSIHDRRASLGGSCGARRTRLITSSVVSLCEIRYAQSSPPPKKPKHYYSLGNEVRHRTHRYVKITSFTQRMVAGSRRFREGRERRCSTRDATELPSICGNRVIAMERSPSSAQGRRLPDGCHLVSKGGQANS